MDGVGRFDSVVPVANIFLAFDGVYVRNASSCRKPGSRSSVMAPWQWMSHAVEVEALKGEGVLALFGDVCSFHPPSLLQRHFSYKILELDK